MKIISVNVGSPREVTWKGKTENSGNWNFQRAS